MDKIDNAFFADDADGLLIYEYMANNIDTCSSEQLDALVDNMIRVDMTGQFLVSASRYLAAIDAVSFASQIDRMVASAIDKDRERKYIPVLLESLYGPDYQERAEVLKQTDNNFRRIYKRVFPVGI